jgi:excisionase family DNA binding protein
MERLTYTVNEVAELLGLSRSKTYELVAGGAIPVLAIPGRRKLVARATLQQLVEPSPNRQAPSTRHDAHDHDPSSIHDQTSPPRPSLPAIPSQPRHSPHTVAPRCAGPDGSPVHGFRERRRNPAEKEKPKTVNIPARNRDVDREVAPSRSGPGYPGQVPSGASLGGGGLAVMDRLPGRATEVAYRCADARRVTT